jgi:hypothetical protein
MSPDSRKWKNWQQMKIDPSCRMGDSRRHQITGAITMAGMTVSVRLSAGAAIFMRKCIGDAEGVERDAFFEAAISALAEELLALDALLPADDVGGIVGKH